MIYAAYIVLIFTIIQFLVSLINLIWRIRLPESEIYDGSLISVLIPARNEESNISNILSDLVKQEYHQIEIIVFNDQSTDNTAKIIRGFQGAGKSVSMIDSNYLPDGWLGKNWACHSLAGRARGDYLLFLDADVRISTGTIKNALAYLKKYQLALLSIFPRQIMYTTGERYTVPVMNFILLSLLPLIMVKKSGRPSLAAANGQFMFFNASVYKKMKPHSTFRKDKVEDILTARMLKRNNQKIACLAGDNTIRCRMYSGFSEAVDGFSKNITEYFGGSFVLAFLFWIITTFGFLFILLSMSFSIFLIYLIFCLLIRVFVSIASEQRVLNNLFFIFPQQISMGCIVFKALINYKYKKYRWKGRSIS